MTRRFFSSDPIAREEVQLIGQEARHLTQVMRAAPGDEVILFDGTAAEFTAVVRELGRDRVSLEVIQRHEVSREASRRLTLAIALPKGDRQRTLVEKCTELGVDRLIPLETARGVAQPTNKALERLRRGVIEASKQCGRNQLMTIEPAQRFVDLVDHEPPGVVAHPAGESLSEPWPTLAAIGPEGGFRDDELDQARARGWRVISLGNRILRVETAAMGLAAKILLG